MMSNSYYSIGLQHQKPVHTAYCGLHNLADNWSWTRDVNGRDRDETETSAFRDRDETEMLTFFLETRPRRDVGTSRDSLETETSRPRPQPCRQAGAKALQGRGDRGVKTPSQLRSSLLFHST